MTEIKRSMGNQSLLSPIKSKWINDYLKSYLRANSKASSNDANYRQSQISPSNSIVCWSPPPDGYWKLNTNVTCSASPLSTGLGLLCRDKNGDIMVASSIYLDFQMEVHMAELKGILEGMKIALSLGFTKVKVESDCLLAIRFITKKSEVWNDVDALVESIWGLMSSFCDISFYFVPRPCNK